MIAEPLTEAGHRVAILLAMRAVQTLDTTEWPDVRAALAAIEAEAAAAERERIAPLHTLLMPPHPGDVYQSSALCSCGEWQYDANTPSDLFAQYRAILRDITAHRGGPR